MMVACVPIAVAVAVVAVKWVFRRTVPAYRHALECGLDLVGQRGELIVHDQDAIIADRDSIFPPQIHRFRDHVNVAGDFGDAALYLAEVLLRAAAAPTISPNARQSLIFA